MHSGDGCGCRAIILECSGPRRGSDRMTYIEELRTVIRHLHRVEATHIESVPVKEVFKGKTVWDGIVEVFELHGHPTASRVYAWAHDTDNPANPRHHVTVLHCH